MRLSNVRMYTAATMLAGCGGGGGGEEEPPSPPLQTYKSCNYEFVPAGLTPPLYTYRCWIRDHCVTADPCTPSVVIAHPECVPGRSTCTACPPGRLLC